MESWINDPTYGLLLKGLDGSSLRHRVTSNNIANVNTKNFKASKVEFEEELKKAYSGKGISLKVSNTRHFGAENALGEPKIIKDEKTMARNDGNNVDIDMEMSKMAANQITYNALIQQTSKKISNLRYVIHEGRR